MERVIVAVLAGGSLLMGAGSVQAQARVCDVIEGSKGTGYVELDTSFTALASKPEPEIRWHPRASNKAIDLSISYRGSTVAKLGAPSGGFASYHLDSNEPKTIEMVFEGGGHEWRLKTQVIHHRPGMVLDSRAVGEFDHGANPDIIGAIEKGGPLKVTVVGDGVVLAKGSFDVNDQNQRNVMLASAREHLETHDPQFCKPVGPSGPLLVKPVAR